MEMYAFYSLLVYIFYTVFKKEEEEEEEDALEGACGASSAVCLATSYPASGGVLCWEFLFFARNMYASPTEHLPVQKDYSL